MMSKLGIHTYVTAVLGLAVLALSLGTWAVPSGDPNGLFACLAVMVGLGVFAEALTLRIDVGARTAINSSVAFAPILTSIVLLGPSWAMLIAGLTMFVGESAFRRKPLIKIIHNSSKEIVAVGLAGLAYVVLGGEPSLNHFDLAPVAFSVAVILYFGVGTGFTTSAVAISTKRRIVDTWNHVVGSSLVYDLFSSSLALLLALLYVRHEWIGFSLVIVSLLFVRHSYNMNLLSEQSNRELLDLMVKTIEARDPYTSGHSKRVSDSARSIARELGLPFREVENIGVAALLHDVGKIYEEFAPILRKVGKLTAEEKLIMKTHPLRSAELIGTISSLRGYVQDCVRHHHEHFDGTGYPYGLVGNDIPVGARIIMVADTADAMLTDRPYRRALTYERVIQELRRLSATQFDARVVDAFCRGATMRMVYEKSSGTDVTSIVRERQQQHPPVAVS